MAKVAKKNASSAKKSVAAKKVVAKKAPAQKKAVAKKPAPVAAKKKAVAKPVAKKAAVKKVVAKKVIAKKAAKPAAPVKKAAKKAAPAKKVVAKKVAPKPVAKAKVAPAKAKVVTKDVKAKVVAKKVAPISKAKAAPAKVTKVEVEKVVKEKAPKKVEAPTKAATVAPVPASAKTPAAPRRKKKKKDDDDDDDEEVVVFRKPTKNTRSASAVKKTSRSNVSEELTMEGPAPKRVGQITMTSDEKVKLKKNLLNKCIDIQKQTVSIAKKAMEDALNSANAEKVSEELSDSFRESMHATRDMYARQANEGVNNLGLLNRINIVEHDKVKFGSVVFTNFQNYFISTGLGEIKVDDLSFQAVSTLAPLFQILVDKRKGDTFMFLDRLYTVVEVF